MPCGLRQCGRYSLFGTVRHSWNSPFFVEVRELAPGLWRWTARHPNATPDPDPESVQDWPPDVGCVAYHGESGVALIDPLVPDEEWEALDELVAGAPVSVLRTLRWHERSCVEAAARYGASSDPPPGVEPLAFPAVDETMFWIPARGALVPGDRLLGAGGGLRLCPESWLGYIESKPTLPDLRHELAPLRELPVRMVLVSHGEPVLERAPAALAAALA